MLAALLFLPLSAARGAQAQPPRFAWDWSLASGYETYVQTFPLADRDTTETISELEAVVAADGHTRGRARHLWSLRPEISTGTEVLRGQLDCGWQYRPDSVAAVLRVDAELLGRRYRAGTRYTLSSNSADGWVEGRWGISPRGQSMGEVRLRAARQRYARESTLERGWDDLRGIVAWRSGHDATRYFSLGARLERRVYPDSTAIDRTIAGLEGELDTGGLGGRGVRLYGRSERRLVDDESARPSAWAHWGTFGWTAAAGAGRIVTDLQTEIWRYDEQTTAWFDSWRLTGALYYQSGGGEEVALGPTWLAGVAGERLDAGPGSPETYNQAGVRVGIESLGTALNGTCTVEVGRRVYALTAPAQPAVTLASSPVESLFLHSDFTYWELWLLGSWTMSSRLSLDLLANYQPERHTEKTDDMAVAFASARLTWRW